MMLVSMSLFKLTDLSLTENVRKVVNSTKKVPKMHHGIISIVLITVVFNSHVNLIGSLTFQLKICLSHPLDRHKKLNLLNIFNISVTFIAFEFYDLRLLRLKIVSVCYFSDQHFGFMERKITRDCRC